MFGIFAASLAGLFFGGFTVWHVLLAGAAAVFVDIDHFICHMIAENEVSFTGMWKRCFNDKYKGHVKHPMYRSEYVHGRTGFFIISAALALLWLWNPMISIALFCAYYSHLFADWITKQKFYGRIRPALFEVRHLLYPVYFDELIFDVFLLDASMIILVWRFV